MKKEKIELNIKYISIYNKYFSLRNISRNISRNILKSIKSINKYNIKASIIEYTIGEYTDAYYMDGYILDNSDMGGYTIFDKRIKNDIKSLSKKRLYY